MAFGHFFRMEAEADGRRVTVTVTLDEDITAENATVLQGQLSYDPEELTPVSVTAADGYDFLTCTISTRQNRIQFGSVDPDSLPLAFAELGEAGMDLLTTEQAFCALEALQLSREGGSLFRMR